MNTLKELISTGLELESKLHKETYPGNEGWLLAAEVLKYSTSNLRNILLALQTATEVLAYYKKDGSVGSHTSGHGESSDHISFYYGLKITPEVALSTIEALFPETQEKME